MSEHDSGEQDGVACHTNSGIVTSRDDSNLTVVHNPTGVQYTFDSAEGLSVMFRSLANFFGVEQSCRNFRLKDSDMTMMDAYEYGWYVLNDHDGYEWLSDAMNDPEQMVREYHNGRYEGTKVGHENSDTDTTVLYEESSITEVIEVFRERGLGTTIPKEAFGGNGSARVLDFFGTLGLIHHDRHNETVMIEDSERATEVMDTLV